jgi:DNA-binding response OmpR family regulator
MKQVLIIDESVMFREYLRHKFEENSIEVSIALTLVDGTSKMRNIVPDLIIMDFNVNRHGSLELLKQKKADINTVNVPVIILSQSLDQKQLIELIPYNVKKVFHKPVKIDSFFATLSEVLDIPFNIDESPCIAEVHVNDNIIFIEIARGLNRDKMDLMRFKVAELITLYDIKVPKVIVMLSNMKLGFADAPNIEKLLDTVIQASKAKPHCIRILTKDPFVHKFIRGQKEYEDIEVVSNLQYAVNDLLSGIDNRSGQSERKAELIGDKILKARSRGDTEAMALKFETETKKASLELMKDMLENLRVAVIDDDFVIQELIKTTFQKNNAIVSSFANGDEYLAVVDDEEFDLAFLDINMPKTGGFDVLKVLQTRNIKYPIIALSAIAQRETMIRAIKMGVKSYLVKPLRADDIFKKSVEILRVNY